MRFPFFAFFIFILLSSCSSCSKKTTISDADIPNYDYIPEDFELRDNNLQPDTEYRIRMKIIKRTFLV